MVASGTAGAQAITMAFAPLVTRLYGPEAFGQLGSFMAILSVVTPIAALAFPIAIVLPRDDRDALGLVRLSAILSFLVALLVAVGLWQSGDLVASVLGAESVAGYLLLIPLAMLFSAWMQIAQQWLIRKKAFSVTARTAVVQSLILNSAKAGIGWLHPVGAALMILATLGNALHAALLLIGARLDYQGNAINKDKERGASLKDLACQHRDFPLYRAPQDFINAASQSLPVLMLASLFGPAAAGFYALGKMVMGMPSMLIGKAVGDVFYPRMTEAAQKRENLSQHILRATGVLLLIGIIPFGLTMILGPWLFSLVFGDEWAMAGEYARWLALFFLLNFINKPSVATVPVLGIQRGYLVYELFSTAAKVLALVIGFYWFGSDLWAIALFSVIGAITYSGMIIWVLAHSIRCKSNVTTN